MTIKDKLLLYKERERLKNLLKDLYNPRLSKELNKSLKIIDSELLKNHAYFKSIIDKDLDQITNTEIADFLIYFMLKDTNYKYISNDIFSHFICHITGNNISQISVYDSEIVNSENGTSISHVERSRFIKTIFNYYEYSMLNKELNNTVREFQGYWTYDPYNFWHSLLISLIDFKTFDVLKEINFDCSKLSEEDICLLKSHIGINKFCL